MLTNINVRTRTGSEYADTLSKEQREQAHERMAQQIAELLAHSPKENLYWTETKTDLMDLLYETYITERLVDGNGRPFTFRGIALRACAVLHVPMPSNPYSIVYNARRIRKGVKQTSMFSRYCWHLYNRRISNPLYGMVKRIGQQHDS